MYANNHADHAECIAIAVIELCDMRNSVAIIVALDESSGYPTTHPRPR